MPVPDLDLGDKWVGVIDISNKPEIKTEILQKGYEALSALETKELKELLVIWREQATHLDSICALHLTQPHYEDDLNRATLVLKSKNMLRIDLALHILEERRKENGEEGEEEEEGEKEPAEAETAEVEDDS